MKIIRTIINKTLSFIIVPLGAILGALGGAENSDKNLRRLFIPLSLMGLAYSDTESILVITIMFMSFAYSLGYGIPDEQWYLEDIKVSDSGSILGRFYYNLFKHNEILANIFTRGTIGILIALFLISIPIIKQNWLVYSLGSLGICMTNAFLSWRNFGSITLFNRKLCIIDLINYGLITLFSVLIIKLGR